MMDFELMPHNLHNPTKNEIRNYVNKSSLLYPYKTGESNGI